MTLYYIPVIIPNPDNLLTNEQIADLALSSAINISRKLWDFIYPPEIRDPTDNSEFYCRWHVHPITKEVVLGIPQVETVSIAISSDTSIILEILQPFIDLGYVDVQEISNIFAAINVSRGQQVKVYDFLPNFWKNLTKTYQDLLNESWFPIGDE